MEDFDRIYFDTNVLITGGWPVPNALLIPILDIARDLNVGLFVPEPTRLETEMVWLRAVYSLRKDDASKTRTQGVVGPELLSTPWDQIRQGYRDAETRLMADRSINQGVPVSFPSQLLPEVFKDGVDLDPPYEGRKEHGFRDTVIYLAVVEHLRKTPAVGVLVSDDKFFPAVGDKRERIWREARGVNLRIIHSPQSQSLEALNRDLEEMRTQREAPERRTWRQHDEERAKAAFQAKVDELRAYIENRVEIPSNFPFRLDFPQIGAVKVGRVITTANQGTADGSSVKLTATVEAKFSAQTVTRATPSEAVTPTLGYGLRTATRDYAWETRGFLHRLPSTINLGVDWMTPIDFMTGIVVVAATAVFHPDRYDDLKFESATLSSWAPP